MAEPWISAADVIAAVAVVVSVASWGHAAFIDRRIKNRDDRRASFDATIASPFSAKLDLLEPILLQLNVICSETDETVRAAQLSELQKKEHSSWFMVTSSFINAQDQKTFDIAFLEVSDYWDRMSDFINDLSLETDPSRLSRLRKDANSLGQKYLTKQRSEIQRRRSHI